MSSLILPSKQSSEADFEAERKEEQSIEEEEVGGGRGKKCCSAVASPPTHHTPKHYSPTAISPQHHLKNICCAFTTSQGPSVVLLPNVKQPNLPTCSAHGGAVPSFCAYTSRYVRFGLAHSNNSGPKANTPDWKQCCPCTPRAAGAIAVGARALLTPHCTAVDCW